MAVATVMAVPVPVLLLGMGVAMLLLAVRVAVPISTPAAFVRSAVAVAMTCVVVCVAVAMPSWLVATVMAWWLRIVAAALLPHLHAYVEGAPRICHRPRLGRCACQGWRRAAAKSGCCVGFGSWGGRLAVSLVAGRWSLADGCVGCVGGAAVHLLVGFLASWILGFCNS